MRNSNDRSPSPDRRGGQGVKTYAVDRLEGEMAVVVADDGATFDVERTQLPQRIREGTILHVRAGKDGQPDWRSAEIDKDEEERRRKEAQETLDELKRTDPGGDVTL